MHWQSWWQLKWLQPPAFPHPSSLPAVRLSCGWKADKFCAGTMESGRVGGETCNCLGWGFSTVALKYERIWRHSTFFCAEVQPAVNPLRDWLRGHAPYCPCPPSGRNEDRKKVTEWHYRQLSSPCTCSAVTGCWQQTAISLNQSSAFLFLIPLPPPANTQQCPAQFVTKETCRCCFSPPMLLKVTQVCCSVCLFRATPREAMGHYLDL